MWAHSPVRCSLFPFLSIQLFPKPFRLHHYFLQRKTWDWLWWVLSVMRIARLTVLQASSRPQIPKHIWTPSARNLTTNNELNDPQTRQEFLYHLPGIDLKAWTLVQKNDSLYTEALPFFPTEAFLDSPWILSYCQKTNPERSLRVFRQSCAQNPDPRVDPFSTLNGIHLPHFDQDKTLLSSLHLPFQNALTLHLKKLPPNETPLQK